MKYLLLLLLLLIAIIFMPELLSAQPGFPENPPQVPIDGGLGILAVAGCAYAAKKLYKRKQE